MWAEIEIGQPLGVQHHTRSDGTTEITVDDRPAYLEYASERHWIFKLDGVTYLDEYGEQVRIRTSYVLIRKGDCCVVAERLTTRGKSTKIVKALMQIAERDV